MKVKDQLIKAINNLLSLHVPSTGSFEVYKYGFHSKETKVLQQRSAIGSHNQHVMPHGLR